MAKKYEAMKTLYIGGKKYSVGDTLSVSESVAKTLGASIKEKKIIKKTIKEDK